jgi:predicted enzyme related to lactoylglutathione lyase
MEPVVHFEMPYEDQKRLSAFYKSAFGWKMQGTSPEMGDYVTATTSEPGPQGRPKDPGTINGGFFPKKPDWPAQVPSVVIGVGSIKKAMQKVAKAGGKVLGEPMDIPGIGQYVSFTDTEGNRVSLLEPAPMGKPAKPKAAAKAAKAAKKKAVKKKKK